jgi:pimeloyl-ACP methyl ester carboxylesterase
MLLLMACAAWAPVRAADTRAGLQPCQLQDVESAAWCGSLRRPLDLASPQGLQIDVHYAVLPALARTRKLDPVLFFAGGPGQSAMDLAGPVGRMLQRLLNRRDVVLVDQRGTGRSAPLQCDEAPVTTPLSEGSDPARMEARLRSCLARLQQLPRGQLGHYATWVAVQDAEAVRVALGARRVNLVGVSYGTRVALDYMRQFPQAVRRVVLDGVAPPDMALPASFSTDNQAALEAVFLACEAEAACRSRHPRLRGDWQALLAGLPRQVSVAHPFTGRTESLQATRDWVLGLVRGPLYVPLLASALPQALSDAAQGRFEPLVGLAHATAGGRSGRIAEGMHHAVVCTEDLPRLALAADLPGADFADSAVQQYRRLCVGLALGPVPAAFYTLGSAPVATLLLSGGADPATPPRHGERVARALGAQARQVVVPQAGHGLLGIGCLRDVLFRFIDAETDAAALATDAACAAQVPRPPAFAPIGAGAAK